MKKYFLFLMTLILLNYQGKGQSVPTVENLTIPELFARAQADTIAAYIAPLPEETQLSIALIRGTSTAFWGIVKKRGTLHTQENSNAAFEIGSITKVFTSTLLSQYVQQGRVGLDDPIQQHLSFPLNSQEPQAQKITLKHLANHTSGLPRMPENFNTLVFDPSNPYKNYDRKALETYLQEVLKLQHAPGERYAYSNLGAGLLGYILGEIDGQSYAALLEEKVFTPLGMSNTAVGKDSLPVEVVTGRDPFGNPTSNWDLNALQGAGAILSTAEDLAVYVKANFEENAAYDLQKEKTVSIDSTMDVALGWHIRHTDAGEKWHWHNGGTGGYRSCLVLNRDTGQGVVLLSNVSAFHPSAEKIDRLCFSLMSTLAP